MGRRGFRASFRPDRVAALLAAKGWTGSELARRMFGERTAREGHRVAKGRDMVSKWLRGHSVPNQASLALLARTLDVDLAWLAPALNGSVPGGPPPPNRFHVEHVGGGLYWVELAWAVPPEAAAELSRLIQRFGANGKVLANPGPQPGIEQEGT